jgi:branched-chain amino acid transport system substrate-binding protein
MRVGGKDVDGSFVSSGPALVANLLPDSNPSKKLGQQYIANYDKTFGAGTANQFGAHAFDVAIVLERIIPEALKKGKPGTQEFRTALRDSLETTGRLPVSQGVLNYTKADHFGFTPDTGVLLKVVNGNWTLAP